MGCGCGDGAALQKNHVRLAWSQKVGELGQWGSKVQATEGVTAKCT